MTDTTRPTAVDRYLAAQDAADPEAVAATFLPAGVVFDEGRTHIGRDAIAAWIGAAATTYTYTSATTAERPLGRDGYRVTQHLEGDFPGGVADLDYTFALEDDTIAALVIL